MKAKLSKDEALKRQIDALGTEQLRNLVQGVAEALWGDSADQEWCADTFDAIAFAFNYNKVGPTQPAPRKGRNK